jgi:hypothetical protein
MLKLFLLINQIFLFFLGDGAKRESKLPKIRLNFDAVRKREPLF